MPKPPGEYTTHYKFDILKIIEARNDRKPLLERSFRNLQPRLKTSLNMCDNSNEGERLIIKIKSHVSEDEIYDDFAKIYRRYRALNRQSVGDYFFKETEDLVNKLCDDFEVTIEK